MTKISTIMIVVALAAPMYGCHRDESRATTPDERHEAREDRRENREEAREDRREEMGERQEARADDREARRDARAEHTDDHAAAEGHHPATASAPPASGSGGGSDAQAQPAQNPPTAQDQPMANDDESITLSIRRAIVADDAITIRGRNTTIITRGGIVTLRGSVERDTERASVEAHARAVPGVRRVDNQIAVSR